MIPWLSPHPSFPPVAQALSEPDGLLAAGGDLSLPRLLAAYRHGIFPWYSPGDPILWWSPSQRMVLNTAQLRVPRSFAKVLRNRRYQVVFDRDFEAVIRACAAPRDGQHGTWIVEDMIQAYLRLFRAGHAHSVETWQDGQLVGGLYAVNVGRMVYGESMFSRAPDASKIALAHLARHLHGHGLDLIDCQMHTGHLASMGARLMLRDDFIAAVAARVAAPVPAGVWEYCFDNEPPRP
jgi:leucyl/phenylalanyl-tRNA--protein transferase